MSKHPYHGIASPATVPCTCQLRLWININSLRKCMHHVAGLYHIITAPTKTYDDGRVCISDSGARFGFQINSKCELTRVSQTILHKNIWKHWKIFITLGRLFPGLQQDCCCPTLAHFAPASTCCSKLQYRSGDVESIQIQSPSSFRLPFVSASECYRVETNDHLIDHRSSIQDFTCILVPI